MKKDNFIFTRITLFRFKSSVPTTKNNSENNLNLIMILFKATSLFYRKLFSKKTVEENIGRKDLAGIFRDRFF